MWQGFLPDRALIMTKRPALRTAPPRTDTSPTSDSLTQVANDLHNCTRCKLSCKRTHVVVGEGHPQAKLLLIGEGPGETEDLEGRPFVGKAGLLLDKMIEALGLRRTDVYIANVVKCRPPGNRNPELDEIAACSPFLERQVALIRPRVILGLGKFAAQTLLKSDRRISELRGQIFDYRGAKLIPTFHPAYLLRNPSSKREAWADLQLAARELGIEVPKR